MSEPMDVPKRDTDHVETVVTWWNAKLPKMLEEEQAFKRACVRAGANGMLPYVAKLRSEHARLIAEKDAEIARLRAALYPPKQGS